MSFLNFSTKKIRNLIPSSQLALSLASCLLGALLAGCQSYQAQLLNLSAHAETWQARGVGDEQVRDFAKRIGKPSKRRGDFKSFRKLSLDEAELVALVYHPDLRLARLQAGVSRATADHAGLWEDPTLNLNILRVTESIPKPWLIVSSLAVTLPISGRLQAEKALAETVAKTDLARIVESEMAVVQKLHDEWLLWSATQLRIQETERMLKSLEAIVETSSRLTEVGELPKTESKLFAIEQETLRLDALRFRAESREQEQKIRSLMGLSPTAKLTLQAAPLALEYASSDNTPDDSHPTLTRLRFEHEVAEKSLYQEIRKQYPDLELGPQIEREEGQSRIGLLAGIPLPILNANKGGIATARAQREVAKAAYETEYERIVGRIAVLDAKIQGLESRAQTLQKNLVPLVDEQVADALRLIELGEGGSLVLLESLTRSQDLKIDLVDLQLAIAQAQNDRLFQLGRHL